MAIASTVVLIRLAGLDDAAQIRSIYNREVEGTTATFDLVPRTLEDQRNWLAARTGVFSAIVAVDPGAPPVAPPAGASAVGDDGSRPGTGHVVGFASLSPYKERAAYRTTVEDSVYVHRSAQGRGIGTALLEHIVDLAAASGFHAVMARIEATGTASRALHARCGFELVGIEREVGRKFGRWLDVAVMQRLLQGPLPSTAAVPVPPGAPAPPGESAPPAASDPPSPAPAA